MSGLQRQKLSRNYQTVLTKLISWMGWVMLCKIEIWHPIVKGMEFLNHVLKRLQIRNHSFVSCFCIKEAPRPCFKEGHIKVLRPHTVHWRTSMPWQDHHIFKLNEILSKKYLCGTEQHLNNLHISCNCFGWGGSVANTLVFCAPHTMDGWEPDLPLQFHFHERFFLKSVSRSPFGGNWGTHHVDKVSIVSMFLHLSFACAALTHLLAFAK